MSFRWYLHGLPKYALGQPKCVLGLGTYMGQNTDTLLFSDLVNSTKKILLADTGGRSTEHYLSS